ncbi:hypothetical protein TWF730_009038 [Orbilia blumenaviensis]|uniref:Uncharacterized protein n=1 Tax=Orbilia blumenaviensis TaxID=1796055 RepID=A0AAV9UYL0_9PEZI
MSANLSPAVTTTGPTSQSSTGQNAQNAPSGNSSSTVSTKTTTGVNKIDQGVGYVLSSLQTDLQFPSNFSYSFEAQASVSVAGSWEILPGFTLESVGLKASIKKWKDRPVVLGFQLDSYIKIGDINIYVSGLIPTLEQNQDVDFVLSLKTASLFDAIPTPDLLQQLKQAAQYDIVSVGNNLLQSTESAADSAFAASASLKITYSSSGKKYLFRGLEVSLGKNADWQIIPSKLSLKRANISLIFARKGTSGPFDAYIAASGQFQAGTDTKFTASARLTIESSVVSLALTCDVSISPLVNSKRVMDVLAGDSISASSDTALALPPDFSYPKSSPVKSQTLVVLQKVSTGWQLDYARTALDWELKWQPISLITLTNIKFFVMAARDGTKSFSKDAALGQLGKLQLQKDSPKDAKQLVYQGYISGTLLVAQAELITFATYDSKQAVTTIGCALKDGEILPLTTLISRTVLGGSTSTGEEATATSPELQDFTTQLVATNAPSSCPINMQWTRRPGMGQDRQFTFSIKDSKLKSLAFSAKFADKYEWKLTNSLKLSGMGISFTYEPPKQTGQIGSMKGLAYGKLKISNNTEVYGIIAGMKDAAAGEFLLYLSVTVGASPTLGIAPESLFNDPSLQEFKPETTGWELSSILPNQQNPSTMFKSVSASVSMRLSQTKLAAAQGKKANYSTKLRFATVSLVMSGEWTIVPDLVLKELLMQARVIPADSTTQTSSSTSIRVKGILNASISGQAYRLALIALFATRGAVGGFSVRLAADAGLTEDLSQEDKQTLPVSPSGLMTLPALGGKAIEAGELSDDTVDKEFPIRPTQVLSSLSAGCVMDVVKSQTSSTWSVSKIDFSITSEQPWVVIQDKLKFTKCRLIVSVKSPRSSSREILVTASTVVAIGSSVNLEAVITFMKKYSEKSFTLDLTANKADVLNVVRELTGQSLESLTPSGAPAFADGQSLALRLIFGASTSTGQQTTGTGYTIQTISIQYQAGASLVLQPFTVKSLSLELNWQTINQKRTVTTAIKGIVQCADVPVAIALAYSQSDPSSVKFTMEPTKDQPLAISKLASTTNVSEPTYTLPSEVKAFTVPNLSNISGTIGIKTTSTPNAKTGLLVLDADVVSDQKISILDIDQSIKIELLYVGIHWHYEADKKSTGSVYAYLRCQGSNTQQGSDYTRTDIRVEYTKGSNNEDIYQGKLIIGNAETPIEYKDVLNKFLPTTTYKIPSTINVPSTIPLLELDAKLVKGKSIELQAVGQAPWTPPAIGETRIQLERVGISLKAWKSASTDTKTNVDVGVTGSLKFNNFRSVDTARAYLSISTASNTVLIAKLEKTGTAVAAGTNTASTDIESMISGSVSTSWKDVSPPSLSTTNLSTTGIVLLVDWTGSKYLLAGQAENSTYRLAFFSKPRLNQSPKTRGYCLCLSSSADLTKIWPDLQNTIALDFSISRCAIQVVALGGNVGEFTTDLAEMDQLMVGKTEFADTRVALTSTNEVLLGAPPSTALVDGAWLFGELQFGGDRELSNALGMLVQPSNTVKLLLYAQIGKGEAVYAIKLLSPLSLLGGSVTISDAIGAYKPAFTKVVSGSSQLQPAVVTLAANVKIEGVTSTPLLLSTTMTTQKGSVSFDAVITTTVSIRAPFTRMFNVELVSIGFSGDISKNTAGSVERFYAISGGVRFGGQSLPAGGETGVKGTILFKDGTPVAASVDFTDPVTISKIFSQIIQPGDTTAGQWPSDFNIITFYNVSLTYVPGAQPVDAPMKATNGTKVYRTYKSGFCVSGDLEIGFEKRLQTSAVISRSGIIISGKYDQIIDLEFMKLSGVTLTIDTTQSKKAYSISSGLEFFGAKDITVELKYIPAASAQSSRFEGTIQRKDSNANDLIGNQLKIIYQDGSFSITGWEFTKTIDDLQNLAKEIENISQNKGACGKIVNFVWNQAVKGKFDYKFSLPKNQKKQKDGKPCFTFEVDWSYTISVLGKKIITNQFLKVPIDIVGPFTLSDFDQMILNFIKQNVPNIATALLDDPVALGELFAMMAVEKLGAEAITSLICRGVRDPKIVDRGNQLVDDAEKDIKSNSDTVKNTNVDTTGGGGGGSGGGSGFGSLLSILGTAIGAAESAGGIAAGIVFGVGVTLISVLSKISDSQKTQLEERRAAARKRAEDAQAALELLKQKIQTYLALSGKPTVVFSVPNPANSNSSTINIDWSNVLPKTQSGGTFTDFEGVTWDIIASPNNNSSDDSALKSNTTDRRATFVASSDKFKTTPSVWIFVRGSVTVRNVTITGSWNVSETVRATLAAPANVDLSLLPIQADGSQQCLVRVTGREVGTYQLQLRPSSDAYKQINVYKQELRIGSIAAPTESRISVTDLQVSGVPAMEPIRAYCKQTPLSGTSSKESTETASLQSITFAASPTNLTATSFGNSATFQWDGQGNSAGEFDVRIKSADGRILETIDTTTGAVVSPGKFKVQATLKTTVNTGDAFVATVTLKTIPSGMIVKQTQTNFTIQALVITNLVQNGDFSRNNFTGWEVNQAQGTATIEQPGLFGASFKAVAAVRAGNPYAGLTFTQNLNTIPGKQYRLSISGRFRDGNNNCYCNLFVNGAYVISRRSGSTAQFNESNPFTAGPGQSRLEINLTNTWYASMTYEIGNIKVELIP